MYFDFHVASPHFSAVAVLLFLLVPEAKAGNYNPMPGSFRPPSTPNNHTIQQGFRQDSNRPVTNAPAPQPSWPAQPQPYANNQGYYTPAPLPATGYQPLSIPHEAWNPTINVNPGYPMNTMPGFGSTTPGTQPTLDYQPALPAAPVYQQPYYYGSSYPQQHYNYSTPQAPQQPAVVPSQPVPKPAPFTRRPFGSKDTPFRPPELKGTD